jgi:hypothetical protein
LKLLKLVVCGVEQGKVLKMSKSEKDLKDEDVQCEEGPQEKKAMINK